MKNWRKKDPKYKLEQKKYPNPVPSREFILETLKKSKKAMSFSAIANIFGLNSAEKETLKYRLKAMTKDLQIEKRKNKKYKVAKKLKTQIGKIIAHSEGYGFFVPNEGGIDLYLSNKEMRQVMHSDIVEAVTLPGGRGDKKEGKIIRVIERANEIIIGKLVEKYGMVTVQAENRRIHQKIHINNLKTTNAKTNQIVEVKITDYPTPRKPICGDIIRVLGDYMDAGLEIDIAIASHNLPNKWSDELIKETAAIPDDLIESDYENRVDLRSLPLVTIDGITARDFDDAVYAKKTKTGYVLYVAIADVAHYVEKNSELDKEAVNRGTSVYFPNRVIPMLPEKLSNGLCSLNPNVDRLCIVCEMLIDNSGNIKRSKFYDAVMHSHARLTYEAVEEVLFLNNPVLENDYKNIIPDLKVLKELYQILRKQRDNRGAIDFRTVEAEFEYDASGKIEHIFARKSLESHKLIEEFMVRANVSAAKFLIKQTGKSKPVALFRNHEGPTKERLEKLTAVLAKINIKLKATEEVLPSQLAEVMHLIKDREDFDYLQIMVLRSMQQAVYEAENLGHFGLALDNYAHFTSPIRRYPDLLVHRAIKHVNNFKGSLYSYSLEEMQLLGKHCSMAERRADDASYDVIGFLKCEYMQSKVGQTFAATLSSVTSFGLFATLDEEFIDGLIHISTLDGDYFHFDQEQNKLIGERTSKVYKTGDKVEAIVSGVNIDDRKIDFLLTEKYLPK